ncbi:MAG: ECF transporter S component [Candidatus Geothermincolia bacterium]
MKKSTMALGALAIVIALWITGGVLGIRALTNLAVMSAVVAVLLLLYYYLRFEEQRGDAKLIAVLATMAALAVAGRLLFAPVPNVKPSTFLIIITGYVFGPISGFMVGATTALVSNIFFGQGPWTIWQMLAWGLAGLVAGLLGPKKRLEGRWKLAVYCAAWGFLFGWIMNLYFVLGFVHPVSVRAFFATYAASAWFDGLHAAGNFVFAFLLGPALVAMLRRYKARFFFEPLEASPVEGGLLGESEAGS